MFLNAIQGFVVIGAIVGTGILLGRKGLLTPNIEVGLSRIVLFSLTPCLIFTMILDAGISIVFSSIFVVSMLSAVIVMTAFIVISRLSWKRSPQEALVGSMAAGFANAGNIGIPVSIYVLGDGAWVTPVVILQSAVLLPTCLIVYDTLSKRGISGILSVLSRTLKSPLIIASTLGITLSAIQIELPALVLEPIRVVGQAAVPVILIAFGITLASGRRPIAPGSHRKDTILATILKLVAMPLAAWALGEFLFGLSASELLAVTVFAALPTAQNVVAFSNFHRTSVVVAKDTALVTTVLSIGPIVSIVLLLEGT